MRISFLCIVLSLAACETSSNSPNVNRFAYELTSSDEGEVRFLLGREGIVDSLPAIDNGTKLGEKWTLVSIPADIVAPDAETAQIDLKTVGIQISHEWDGVNPQPYSDQQGIPWVRLDMETEPGTTTGALEFDRSQDGGFVTVMLNWEGNVDLYDTGEASFFRLELQTSLRLAGK